MTVPDSNMINISIPVTQNFTVNCSEGLRLYNPIAACLLQPDGSGEWSYPRPLCIRKAVPSLPSPPAIDVGVTSFTIPVTPGAMYTIQYKTLGSPTWIVRNISVSENVTEVTISGLKPGGVYEVGLVGYDTEGQPHNMSLLNITLKPPG